MKQPTINRNHFWGVAALVLFSFFVMFLQEPFAGIVYFVISVPFFWMPYLTSAFLLKKLTPVFLFAQYIFASLTLVALYFFIFSTNFSYSDSPRYFMMSRYEDPEMLPSWASTASDIAMLTFAGSLLAICAVNFLALYFQSRRPLVESPMQTTNVDTYQSLTVQPITSVFKKLSSRLHLPSSMIFFIVAALIAFGFPYSVYTESFIVFCVAVIVFNMFSKLEITRDVVIVHYGPFRRGIKPGQISSLTERVRGTYRLIFRFNPVPYSFVLSRYANGFEVAEQLSVWARAHNIDQYLWSAAKTHAPDVDSSNSNEGDSQNNTNDSQ